MILRKYFELKMKIHSHFCWNSCNTYSFEMGNVCVCVRAAFDKIHKMNISIEKYEFVRI